MKEKIGQITLDDKHYPGKDFYCDGAVEDELLEIVKRHDSGQFRRIIEERPSGRCCITVAAAGKYRGLAPDG